MLQLVTPTQDSSPIPPAPAPVARPEDEAARAGLEATRLAAAERYGVLDTAPELAFDRITALTAELFQAPVAIIGFIGSDRVFFKSHHGTAETEARRGTDPSHSVLEPWIRDNYKHGFHAGVPLDSPDGYAIGTLSVIDRRPRRIDEQHMRRLRALAGIVTDELAMRLAARRALVQADIMKSRSRSPRHEQLAIRLQPAAAAESQRRFDGDPRAAPGGGSSREGGRPDAPGVLRRRDARSPADRAPSPRALPRAGRHSRCRDRRRGRNRDQRSQGPGPRHRADRQRARRQCAQAWCGTDHGLVRPERGRARACRDRRGARSCRRDSRQLDRPGKGWA